MAESVREQAASAGLEPAEVLVAYGIAVPAKSAKGVRLNHFNPDGRGRRGAELGDRLMQSVGAVSGGAGSIAASMPETTGALLLRITDRRVGLVNHMNGTPVWEVPRGWVVRVERRPRLQVVARFRVHYADGSWLGFFTMRRRTIDEFQRHLGA
ncbi:hypothetical protein [Yinghuangia seranimata]|uniref:hypothetical protein n=1 Tax=Yinghuangia seranimata TaxID=408067 RepID=UPI00248BB6C5|nr:hypothetical protein [Yinghuangia seranimata]MDI2125477.1 hypothetical protein [Yinghuangia seranimata]